MSILDPVLTAPIAIQMHFWAAVVSIAIGPFALFRRRRDKWHRWLGRVWVFTCGATAISGSFIHSEMAVIAHFGPIHLLSVYALWGLTEGVWHIRGGRVAKHRASMQSVWFGAMGWPVCLSFCRAAL